MKKRHLLFVALAFVSALVLAGGQKFDSASQVLDAFASELLSAYGGDEVIDNYSGSGEKFAMGDVNHDKAIDVTDAVLIIDQILEKNPENFDASLADVNGDGDIDVTDVVTVIDVILGKVTLSRNAESEGTVCGVLSMPQYVNLDVGETVCVPLALSNTTAYTAFQMDVVVPEGISLKSVALTERVTENHQVTFRKLSDGSYRIICWSLENDAIEGVSGDLIQLNLENNSQEAASVISVDDIMFVTTEAVRHQMSPISAFAQPTGIAQISIIPSQTSTKVFDLQGRRVNGMKGLYIMKDKKYIAK